MTINPGYVGFKTSYQISPIMFVGGIATNMGSSGMIPIAAITDAGLFTQGLLVGAEDIPIDNFFANYEPLPGSTLLDHRIGEYPFPDQSTAANALIVMPLHLSMKMLCPVQFNSTYQKKLSTIQSLKAAFDNHAQLGGTYTINTPAYIYTGCLLTAMRDVSPGVTQQRQMAYQLDFEQPLITLSEAQQSMNTLTSRMNAGLPITGQPANSGGQTTTGAPLSSATSSVIPSLTKTPATSTTLQQFNPAIPTPNN